MAAPGTPLARRLRTEIEAAGPMPVSAFMAHALTDPDHGYYTTATPFGAGGDFITAPEVSQMFGEIVGAWLVHVGEAIAAALPDERINLVELGPGRGTLMADILRVARLRPDLDRRLDVHLVEASGKLRQVQAATVAAARPNRAEPRWHDAFADVPEGPTVVVANEFFDALPIEQAVMTQAGWRQRVVALAGDGFAFAAGESPATVPPQFADMPAGTIFETCPHGEQVAAEIAARLTRFPGAALLIDYGHDVPAPGDTLQAVRRHEYADPLHAVGEADITAHVCFGALAEAARNAGAQAFGPITQAQFLSDLGIAARADALVAAGPGRRTEVEAALARLVSPDAMGALFKVMALASPGMGALPPFPQH